MSEDSKHKAMPEKEPIPEPRTITLPPSDFQPGKADMEAAYDMPGASMDVIRSAVFRPFRIRREDKG